MNWQTGLLAGLAALVMTAMLSLAVCLSKGQYQNEIEFSKEKLEAQWARVFPHEEVSHLLLQWQLDAPNFVLESSATRPRMQLELRLTARIDGMRKTLHGQVEVELATRYDGARKALYFTQPVITRFDMPEVPNAQHYRVQESLIDVLTGLLDEHEIYVFPRSVAREVQTLNVESARIENDKLIVSMTF